MNNVIMLLTKNGEKYYTSKEDVISALEDVISALLDFDEREPDKTYPIWEDLAKKLYTNDEL